MSRDALYMSIGFAVACAQMRAELMATQSWLEDEVAELRKELAAAHAELRRLHAIDCAAKMQRDPEATLN